VRATQIAKSRHIRDGFFVEVLSIAILLWLTPVDKQRAVIGDKLAVLRQLVQALAGIFLELCLLGSFE
jgi:hypothetical protein